MACTLSTIKHNKEIHKSNIFGFFLFLWISTSIDFMNTKYGTVLTTDNGNLCSTIADIKKVLIVYTICGITILDIWANKLDL